MKRTSVVGKGSGCVICLEVSNERAEMASASRAATASASGVAMTMASASGVEVPTDEHAAPPVRKARTVAQIKVKAVSSKTIFT